MSFRSSLLFGTTLLLQTGAALAISPGTYEGGFDTPSDTLQVKLRCATATAPRPVCELETSARSGERRESLQPTPDAMEPLGGCLAAPKSQWDECNLDPWSELKQAMDFAREHQRHLQNKEAKRLLKPVLSGHVTLSSCVRFNRTESVVFCEMTTSPWSKPAILYFDEIFGPCSTEAPFCGFFILPLFKTSDTAELKGFGIIAPPVQPRIIPDSQSRFAPYIAALEASVHRALKVPSGTPPTARLVYQIQFSPTLASVNSVNFIQGCYCPDFRAQVEAAVRSLNPFPLPPRDEQAIVGDRVYLETCAE